MRVVLANPYTNERNYYAYFHDARLYLPRPNFRIICAPIAPELIESLSITIIHESCICTLPQLDFQTLSRKRAQFRLPSAFFKSMLHYQIYFK